MTSPYRPPDPDLMGAGWVRELARAAPECFWPAYTLTQVRHRYGVWPLRGDLAPRLRCYGYKSRLEIDAALEHLHDNRHEPWGHEVFTFRWANERGRPTLRYGLDPFVAAVGFALPKQPTDIYYGAYFPGGPAGIDVSAEVIDRWGNIVLDSERWSAHFDFGVGFE